MAGSLPQTYLSRNGLWQSSMERWLHATGQFPGLNTPSHSSALVGSLSCTASKPLPSLDPSLPVKTPNSARGK